MGPTSRPAVWLSALGIGLFQVVGSFGAAANQPGRRGIDAAALLLVVLGPLALAVRDRLPLVAVAVAAGAAEAWPAGPCSAPRWPWSSGRLRWPSGWARLGGTVREHRRRLVEAGYRFFPGQVLAALIRGGTVDLGIGRAALTAVLYTGIAAAGTLVLVSRRDVNA